MPITSSAKKALRGSLRKAEVNRKIKSRVKTMIDKVKAEPTQANLAEAYSAIDRAVKGNIFHRNRGARMKAQLSKLLPKTEMGKKLKRQVVKTKKTKKSAKAKKVTKKIAKKPVAKKATKTTSKKK